MLIKYKSVNKDAELVITYFRSQIIECRNYLLNPQRRWCSGQHTSGHGTLRTIIVRNKGSNPFLCVVLRFSVPVAMPSSEQELCQDDVYMLGRSLTFRTCMLHHVHHF